MVMKKFFLIFLLLSCWVITGNAQAATNDQAVIITTDELKAILDTANAPVVVIDARNPEEYQEVHIKGAINIPASKFREFKHLLPNDKSVKLIFYCNGVKCGKSKRAAQKAAEEGYSNTVVYADGMPVWEEKGYPIYAGPDYEKHIETTTFTPIGLQDLIKKDRAGTIVVDVRDPQEYTEGHIPGAINIPSEIFASKSDVLDKEKKIVVYCNSGGRSYNAYRKLMKLGYENIYQSLYFDWKQQGLPVEK
jgi:rhodanese-related sulfurtransferase